jgi:hypothetical protein
MPEVNMRQQEIDRLLKEIAVLTKTIQAANMVERDLTKNKNTREAATNTKTAAVSKLQSLGAAIALMSRPPATPTPLPSSSSGYTYNIPGHQGGRRKKSHKKAHKKHARRTRRHR